MIGISIFNKKYSNYNRNLKSIFTIVIIYFSMQACNNSVSPTDKVDDIYVLEKDHIFGGFQDVDIYHHTMVINPTKDTILFNLECPIPEGQKRESIRSPAFGRNAFIPTEFSNYFSIPNIVNDFIIDQPDTFINSCYFWNNQKLAQSNAFHIPYSNYFGEGAKLFNVGFGKNDFMGLNIFSEYKIDKDNVNNYYLNLEIKQTIINKTKEKLYSVGVVLHIPRELNTKPKNTMLYELISDSVFCSEEFNLDNDYGYGEGFGLYRSSGQTITLRKDVLESNGSFTFIFKMKIKPCYEKFEIYPMNLIYFETKGERIWPKSIIKINGKKYEGNVDYLKVCGLSIPTYILFSINDGKLRVVSQDSIKSTF